MPRTRVHDSIVRRLCADKEEVDGRFRVPVPCLLSITNKRLGAYT